MMYESFWVKKQFFGVKKNFGVKNLRWNKKQFPCKKFWCKKHNFGETQDIKFARLSLLDQSDHSKSVPFSETIFIIDFKPTDFI